MLWTLNPAAPPAGSPRPPCAPPPARGLELGSRIHCPAQGWRQNTAWGLPERLGDVATCSQRTFETHAPGTRLWHPKQGTVSGNCLPHESLPSLSFAKFAKSWNLEDATLGVAEPGKMGTAAPGNRCLSVLGLSEDGRVHLVCSSYAQTQPRPVREHDQEVNQLPAQLDSRIIAGEIAKQVGFLDEMCRQGSPHRGRVDKFLSQVPSLLYMATHASIYGVSCVEICTWLSAHGNLEDTFYDNIRWSIKQ